MELCRKKFFEKYKDGEFGNNLSIEGNVRKKYMQNKKEQIKIYQLLET